MNVVSLKKILNFAKANVCFRLAQNARFFYSSTAQAAETSACIISAVHVTKDSLPEGLLNPRKEVESTFYNYSHY